MIHSPPLELLGRHVGQGSHFGEIADDAIAYIKGRYSRPADDVARMEVLKEWFSGRAAETITPDEIEAKLSQSGEENYWSPSTLNHHHTLLSLTYRLAIRNRKAKEHPMRGIRRRAKDNSRVRFLRNIAELLGHKTLAMSRRYAHLSIANLHEAVSRIATGTTIAPEQVAEAPQVAYVH